MNGKSFGCGLASSWNTHFKRIGRCFRGDFFFFYDFPYAADTEMVNVICCVRTKSTPHVIFNARKNAVNIQLIRHGPAIFGRVVRKYMFFFCSTIHTLKC